MDVQRLDDYTLEIKSGFSSKVLTFFFDGDGDLQVDVISPNGRTKTAYIPNGGIAELIEWLEEQDYKLKNRIDHGKKQEE